MRPICLRNFNKVQSQTAETQETKDYDANQNMACQHVHLLAYNPVLRQKIINSAYKIMNSHQNVILIIECLNDNSRPI